MMQEGYPVYERFHSWQEKARIWANQHSLFVYMVARCIASGVTRQVPGIRIINLKTLLG